MEASAPKARVRLGDRIFEGLSRSAGVLLLAIMGGIGAFLIWKAVPALRLNTVNFLTYQQWFPDAIAPDKPRFGIAALAWGTLTSSLIALLLATPTAIGIALFISHYAPRRLAQLLGYIVDLLAAVPSVIYG